MHSVLVQEVGDLLIPPETVLHEGSDLFWGEEVRGGRKVYGLVHCGLVGGHKSSFAQDLLVVMQTAPGLPRTRRRLLVLQVREDAGRSANRQIGRAPCRERGCQYW